MFEAADPDAAPCIRSGSEATTVLADVPAAFLAKGNGGSEGRMGVRDSSDGWPLPAPGPREPKREGTRGKGGIERRAWREACCDDSGALAGAGLGSREEGAAWRGCLGRGGMA